MKNQHVSANELSVELVIYDFKCEASVITEVLDIPPTETFKKGERISSKVTNIHSYNGWVLESGIEKAESRFEEHIEALLLIIEPKLANFEKLPSECQRVLSCGLMWNNRDERPGFFISPQALKTFAQIGASIDIALF